MNEELENEVQSALGAGRELAAVEDRIMWFGDANGPQVPVSYAHGAATLAVDILKAIEERREHPTHRHGTRTLTEVSSFIEAVNRWSSESTVIYANAADFRLEAVLDENPAGAAHAVAPDWRKDRIVYTCPRSSEWLAWTAIDGKEMPQAAFGDFLESRYEDIMVADGYPKPLEVLTVSRKLSVKTRGEYTREHDPTTGNHVLVSKSENTSDSTPIPRAFKIAIPVFEGGVRYEVEARVRMRVDGGALFTLILHRRKEVERLAFDGVRAGVGHETKRLVLAGTP